MDNTAASSEADSDSLSTVDIPSVIALGILITSLCYLLYSLFSLCRESIWGSNSNSTGESKEYHSVRQAEEDGDEEEGEESAIEMTYAS